MSALQYVGRTIGADKDLVYQDYISQVKAGDLTVAEIDNIINTRLANYATIGYVDSRDSLNATKAYVDAGDATRLKLAQKTIPNGVVPLDATGRVPPERINAPLTQKWVRGPWTPAAYHGGPVSVTATPTALYTCPVTPPGFPYRLMVFGTLDARSDRETEYPVVTVRVGGANGEIVAQGVGSADVPDSVAPVNGEKFAIPHTTGLDAETWNQTSITGSGGFYKVEGGQATWEVGGTAVQEWRYRRLGVDATTRTNYQKLRMTIGTYKGGDPFGGNPHRTRLCARMNEAETDWVGFELTHDTFTMQHSLDGAISVIPSGSGGWITTGSSFGTDPAPGVSYDILAGTVSNLRQFYFYRNNVMIGQAFDGSGVSKADSLHRGWGWYGRASNGLFSQNSPPDIAELLIADTPPSFGSVSVMPIHTSTVFNGGTTLYVVGGRSGSASTQLYSPYKPRLNVFVVPA